MGLPTALSFREKVEFLGSLDIFSRLEIKDLVKIAAISKQYGFDTGKVFIHQGDVADKLYIVHSGRLEAVSINDEGVSRRERLYLPNQLFEDSWLFNPSAHSSSIKARQGGLLIIISSSDFLRMLDRPENKHIGTILNLTDEGREEYIKSPLARSERRYKSINLVPGELVEFETKRSRWVLFGKMILPTIGLLTVPLATYIFLPQFFPNLSFNWTLGIVGIFLFIFGFYAWFEWYDWANDYLIITNKRLVHYEFELRSFSGRGQDTNISQVQSVESVRPNIISNILQVGTARVTTSALSVLYFDFLPQPEKIQETISRIQRRQGTMSAGQEKATMRRSVENYFKIPEMLFKLEEEPPPRPPETAWERFQKQWASLPLYRYRTEEGDMITYRKHVFALFIETVWPAGFMVLLGLVLIGLSFFGADQYAGIVVVIMILDGLWFIWLAEDWRNDTFQLSDTYVIDIDRLPFGFGESRKQARLDNIQNVEADRPNIIATILNYGNVEIETAGADAKIVFENVSNPQSIKNDVFKKQNKYESVQRQKRDERDRQKYAIALDVFVQESELNRINRRTPDFEQAIEDITDDILSQQSNE